MTEYRIVTKIDPAGVTTGGAKVKQELRGIDTAAAATKRNINQAFDSSQFDRSIGSLITRMESLEGSMMEVSRTSTTVAASNSQVASSLDRLATSSGRAGAGLGNVQQKGRGAAMSQTQMEAATRRVLAAVDQEALELQRLNALLAEAKVLHERGVITADQYARVQTMVTAGIKQQIPSLQQQRAGYMMAGQQVQDWTQQLAMGINPLVVLAQQGGQTASALQMALGQTGTAGKVATFMAGPWGSLILAGTAVLGMFAYRALTAGEDVGSLTDKLRDDAREAEQTARAQEVFGTTLDGVTDALRRNREALGQLDEQHKSAARRALEDAIAANMRLQGIRTETVALIEQARAMYEVQRARASGPGQQGELAALNLSTRYAELDRLQGSLTEIDRQVAESDRQIQDALSRRMVELADTDQPERIRRRYEGLIEQVRTRAVAEGTVSTELYRQVDALRRQRDLEIQRYQESQRHGRSDGVARFRTRQQAIGIAGRELQRGGLSVGENEQFGGVHGNHPGMGNAAHGQFAVDVNSGSGVTEANVPDLRRRFDELARRYQARGYEVLWNGMFYAANGQGPTRAISGRTGPHRDHMHIQAPQSIVGRPTGASTEGAEIAGERRERTAAEQQGDFVQGVEDEAATRGRGTAQADTLRTRLERTFADFRRRFNREVDPDERARITNALTDADARETAQRFDQAYVEPLRRLEQLQGTTGIARQVLNSQLEESERLGRALTPVERDLIDSSIRHADALERQAGILADIRQPVQDYMDQLAALNALLERGEISQTAYNGRVAQLGEAARNAVRDVPGIDSNTGRSYGDLAARADEESRFAQQLATFESQKAQLLALGINYDRLVENAHREHVRRMDALDRARRDTLLASAQEIFGSLTSIAETSLGKQSAIFKVMFAIEKAIAIARSIVAIQTGIAQAAALPFPANLGAMATVVAATASIIANIQAVKLNFREGGLVRGPGGPRDDRVPINASDGEFVVNAAATARNRALLEAINNGATMARSRKAANDTHAATAGGGDSYSLQFGDVIVQTGGGTSAADGRLIGRDVKAAIVGIVREEIVDAKRGGGALTTVRPSVMTGG